MKTCKYCGKKLLDKRRTYCNDTCKQRYHKFGPAREQYVYHDVDTNEEELLELTKRGAWILMRASQTDEQCIADFMRVWKRAPEHVIFIPSTPFWKFVGPVWNDEELNHRWRGYNE